MTIEKLTPRRALELIMAETADPVGLLVDLRGVFQQHAECVELDSNVRAAYADAVNHLNNAMDEFRRRGMR